LIVLELYKGKGGPKRYSEIKKSLQGITPKMLSARLKELEKHGMIKKQVDTKTIPIKCEYSLTASGKDFVNVIKDIKTWGVRWGLGKTHCRETSCKSCDM
jgi:DNA-binding HxlR family transcriptional regulator